MNYIPGGGNFHDMNNIGKHFYYEGRKRGENNDVALVNMGISSIGIGCKMLWDVWSRTRAGKKGRGR
jgi:purine-nucleoside phosphorylase